LRYKRRKPNTVAATTTTSSSFTISLKEHHPAESAATSTEETHGTLTGHREEAYSRSPEGSLPKRTNHTDFIIDLTTLQREAYNGNKRNVFSKASSMEQAVSLSDDDWTPTIGPRRATHKAKTSKQIARARAVAKLNTGHSKDPELERLACIQIPSNARPSKPSGGPTQRFLHIDIKTNIKPTVTQARIDAKRGSASNADNSATPDMVHTTEEIDNYLVGSSTSNVHRSVIDFNTLAIPTGTVDNTRLDFLNVHTFEKVVKPTEQMLSRPSNRDDQVLVDFKPNSPDAHPINSVRKPRGEATISSIQDLCSPPPTPSPYSSATGGTDEDLLPRNIDHDDANNVDTSSLVDAAVKTDTSPARIFTIESNHALDNDSPHEMDVCQSTIPGSCLPEEMDTTLVDSDFIPGDLLKDLADSRINPSIPEQTHSQSLTSAVVDTNATSDANNTNDLLDASDSHKGHLNDTSEAPTTSRGSLVSTVNAITVNISQADAQPTEVDHLPVSPGDIQDNQMTKQAYRTISATPFEQAAPQSTITLPSDRNTANSNLSDPLTGPYSKYATGDINKVISYEVYSQFSAKTQRAFVDHLPACIRNNPRYLDRNTGTATEAFFSMLSFNRAKVDWQKALAGGKFTDEYKTKVAALRREYDDRNMARSATKTATAATTAITMMEGHKEERWKSDDFERFYGEKAIQASVRKMEAGDSSKTSLAKICLNKGIQVGDLLLYVREFTVNLPLHQQPSPRQNSNVNVATTTTSTALSTPLPSSSAVPTTELVPEEQTARRRWIAWLSRMAMIDKHDNKDKGLASSRADRIKVDQLMQVLDITQSGRPIIRFIDSDGCSNHKDHKSTNGQGSKPLVAVTTAGAAATANTAIATMSPIATPTKTKTKTTTPTILSTSSAAASATSTVAMSSPRINEKGQQQQQPQLRSPTTTTKLTGTYEIDSAMMIERICLERNGQVPKAYRKNAYESWKHIHTFRPTGRDFEDQQRMKMEGEGEGEREVEVIYVGSLFSMRMDIYNHLQSENAKKQVLLEDAAATTA
jgi:hypothetical protein